MKKMLTLVILLVIASSPFLFSQTLTARVYTGHEDYGYYNRVVFTLDGNRGFVTDPNNKVVIVFDPRRWDNNIITTIPTGDEPAGIFITPDGSHVCVLNIYSDDITIIRTSDYQTTTYIPPAGTDFIEWNNIAFTADSQYGIVCNAAWNGSQYANQIYVFRVSTTSTNLHRATISNTGEGPIRVYVNPSGDKAFILCDGKTTDDQISVLNLSNFTLSTTFTVWDADFDRMSTVDGVCLNNIVFSPDGKWGFVCDPQYNDVVGFNMSDYGDQPFLDISSEGTTDASLSRLAISPDGSTLLAVSTLNNVVYVINESDLTLRDTIEDSSGLVDFDGYNNILFSSDGIYAYIASVGSNELLKLNITTGNIVSYTPTNSSPELIAQTADERFLAVVCVEDEHVDIFSLNPKVINIPYFTTANGQFTGYAISNPTNEPITVIAFATDKDGNTIAADENPKTTVVEPGNQKSFVGDNFFGIHNSVPSGWIQLICNNDDVRSFFLTTNVNNQGFSDYMDGTVASDVLYTDFYITHVREDLYDGSSNNQTKLFFANPNPVSVNLTLTLRKSDSDVLGTITQEIAPGAMLTGTLHDLFLRDQNSLDIQEAYISGQIDGDSGITGFALVKHIDDNGVLQTIHSVPLQNATGSSTLYCAHVATGGEKNVFLIPYNTTFHILNTALEDTNVTFTFYEDGTATQYSTSRMISEGNLLTVSAAQLFGFPFPDSWPPYQTGYVVIKSDHPSILGDVVFGDGLNDIAEFESCLVLDQVPYDSCVFSHVANGPVGSGILTYFNGISIVNPGNDAIDVVVSIYKEDGTLTGTKTLHIDAYSRFLSLISADQLIPDSWGQLGGYVTLSSNSQFVAFELFTDNHSKILSAIPRN